LGRACRATIRGISARARSSSRSGPLRGATEIAVHVGRSGCGPGVDCYSATIERRTRRRAGPRCRRARRPTNQRGGCRCTRLSRRPVAARLARSVRVVVSIRPVQVRMRVRMVVVRVGRVRMRMGVRVARVTRAGPRVSPDFLAALGPHSPATAARAGAGRHRGGPEANRKRCGDQPDRDPPRRGHDRSSPIGLRTPPRRFASGAGLMACPSSSGPRTSFA
jgi:hypothetical protein